MRDLLQRLDDQLITVKVQHRIRYLTIIIPCAEFDDPVIEVKIESLAGNRAADDVHGIDRDGAQRTSCDEVCIELSIDRPRCGIRPLPPGSGKRDAAQVHSHHILRFFLWQFIQKIGFVLCFITVPFGRKLFDQIRSYFLRVLEKILFQLFSIISKN